MSARGKVYRYAVRATLADKREAVIVPNPKPVSENKDSTIEMVKLKPMVAEKGDLGGRSDGDTN